MDGFPLFGHVIRQVAAVTGGGWQLSLPNTIRVFDYGTISDVILHLSYTADFDGVLKNKIESELESEAQRLLNLLKIKETDPIAQKPPMTRSFSLREEFPDAFHRLSTSPLDTEIEFTIEQRHFPFFLMGKTLRVDAATLRVLSPLSSLADTTVAGVTTPGTKFAIRPKIQVLAPLGFRDLTAPALPTYVVNGPGMRQFDFGDVLKKDLTDPSGITPEIVGDYLIKLEAAGPLKPDPSSIDGGVIDQKKLRDIIIEVGYGIA